MTKNNELYTICLDIFSLYNNVVRTPVNWQEERNRLLKNPKSRANWQYNVPDLSKYSNRLKKLRIGKTNIPRSAQKKEGRKAFYMKYEKTVTESMLGVAEIKLDVLHYLQKGGLKSDLELRKNFYHLEYNFDHVQELWKNLKKTNTLKKIGEEFGNNTYTPQETAVFIEKILQHAQSNIEKVVSFPSDITRTLPEIFKARVKIIDDPSFLMRCTTDPTTKITSLLLTSHKKYSPLLTKIGALHEFAGHALEMAVFDNYLIEKENISPMYGYAGISSPSLFDVKAEVFADKILIPFLSAKEQKYYNFRRNVWLLCRAMGDYLYHFEQKTIADVMEIFSTVGLHNFAFDEAIMASIFIDGYQGMYLHANETIENMQRQYNLTIKELNTRLLFQGKLPLATFSKIPVFK